MWWCSPQRPRSWMSRGTLLLWMLKMGTYKVTRYLWVATNLFNLTSGLSCFCHFNEKQNNEFCILHSSVYRSISGSFSSRMRRSACVLCSCLSSGWRLRTWQATPPTWSVWRPSTLRGTDPVPCPPEGALSKQVSYTESRCGWWVYYSYRSKGKLYLSTNSNLLPTAQGISQSQAVYFFIPLCLSSICLFVPSAQWFRLSLFNHVVCSGHVVAR